MESADLSTCVDNTRQTECHDHLKTTITIASSGSIFSRTETSGRWTVRYNQLYQLLDHLDEHSNRSSPADFITMLDQLSLSPVLDPSPQPISKESSNDQEPSDDVDEIILPEFFDHPLPTAQEKRFYTTFAIPLTDPSTLRLYVMTCSIVQFSASIYIPYSVLAGRRPVLASSKQTSFTPVRSKRKNYTCQVTAVESSLNLPELKPNDILLKVSNLRV